MKKKTKIILGVIFFILLLITGYGGFLLGMKGGKKVPKTETPLSDLRTGYALSNDKPIAGENGYISYLDEIPEIKDGTILKTDEDLVNDLYSKIELFYIPRASYRFTSYENYNYYIDKLVDYNTYSDDAKLYYAYHTIGNIKERKISNCKELSTYIWENNDMQETCEAKPAIISETSILRWKWFNVNKAILEEAYHNLYGNDKKMPLKTFTIIQSGACLYSKIKDDFLCFDQQETGSFIDFTRNKIKKAIQYDDRIEIYDRFVYVDFYDTDKYKMKVYLKSRFQNDIIKEEINNPNLMNSISNEILEQGAVYKHTFKKDSTGNYYWYSSERI